MFLVIRYILIDYMLLDVTYDNNNEIFVTSQDRKKTIEGNFFDWAFVKKAQSHKY